MITRVKQDKPSLAWIPVFVWAAAIFWFSVMPCKTPPPFEIRYLDKIAHFFVYAVLAVLTFRGMYIAGSFSPLRNSVLTLIWGGGYGTVMELVQVFIPGRDASSYDVLANIAGILVGIVLCGVVLWQRKSILWQK